MAEVVYLAEYRARRAPSLFSVWMMWWAFAWGFGL